MLRAARRECNLGHSSHPSDRNQRVLVDLGLTLFSISLIVLIFIVFALREAGLPGRIFFDLIILTLRIIGTPAVNQSRLATVSTIVIVLAAIIVLITGRIRRSL